MTNKDRITDILLCSYDEIAREQLCTASELTHLKKDLEEIAEFIEEKELVQEEIL